MKLFYGNFGDIGDKGFFLHIFRALASFFYHFFLAVVAVCLLLDSD